MACLIDGPLSLSIKILTEWNIFVACISVRIWVYYIGWLCGLTAEYTRKNGLEFSQTCLHNLKLNSE